MLTISDLAEKMRRRSVGFAARGNTIFNGAILAEELEGWANEVAALSPPDHSTDEVDELCAFLRSAGGAGDCHPIYIEAMENAAAEITRLRAGLQSIADNTCCDGCQEAAKWARATLNPAPIGAALLPKDGT